MEPLSAAQLRNRWKQMAAATEVTAFDVIPTWCMPPWEEICEQLSWQHYVLDDGYFDAKRFGCCGVYRIVALEADKDISRPATLNRLCDQDKTGTLYIGQSSRLSDRMNQLRRTTRGRGERSHGAYGALLNIKKINFPVGKLAVALMFTGRDTKYVEGELIRAYMNSYGDPPVLNYRV